MPHKESLMRRLLPLILLCLSWPLHAQDAQVTPKDLQPLPESAPPPPRGDLSPEAEPEITIIKRGEDVVQEYRVNGRLYMLKVTPRFGPPYYMIDDRGDGKFARQDNLDSGVRVPQWVLFNF